VYSFLVLAATTAQGLVAILFNDIRVTMLKVRRFERYEEQMKAKWGPDVLI
jgi:hypothetical protein